MRKTLTLLSMLLALLTLTVLPLEAEAKRFGSGGNAGKQYSVPSKPAGSTSAQPAAPAAAPAAAARPSGASRWLGPLAGLAAGGLFAWLLFGDGFHGFQMFDLLLLAGVAIGGVMLLRALRNRAPQPQAAGGPGGLEPPHEEEWRPAPAAAAPVSQRLDAPEWFEPGSFVEGAKTHFLRLQAAWDKEDLDEIRSYTAPELFAELSAELARRGSERNFTDVMSLKAELADVRRDGDLVVASVRYYGLIREEEGAAPHDFHEVWHVQHPWAASQGDWLIVGIQQQ